MTSISIMQFAPAALERGQAAAYVSLSVSTFEKWVQEKKAPQPRQFPGRRVAWLRAELDAWLISLPLSDQLPPENTGAKKPRMTKAEAIARQVAPNAEQAS